MTLNKPACLIFLFALLASCDGARQKKRNDGDLDIGVPTIIMSPCICNYFDPEQLCECYDFVVASLEPRDYDTHDSNLMPHPHLPYPIDLSLPKAGDTND